MTHSTAVNRDSKYAYTLSVCATKRPGPMIAMGRLQSRINLARKWNRETWLLAMREIGAQREDEREQE